MGNNSIFFTNEASIKTIDRLRIAYLGIAVLFLFLTEIGRKVYRPFIYSNNIDDYGFADSIGNLGGIIVQIFFTLAMLNAPKKKIFHIIGFIVTGYIIYEILQPYLPRGVFDWKDVYGTLIGGVLSFFIWYLANTFIKNKVYHKFK